MIHGYFRKLVGGMVAFWSGVLVVFAQQGEAESYVWDSVTIGGGGFVSAIIAHPQEPGLIYARTDVGGAYRWEVDAQRWRPLFDWVSEQETSFLGVESLAIDPSNPARVYAVGGTSYWNQGKTAFLRSADRGATWQVVDVSDLWRSNGNGMGRQSGEKLVVDPNFGSVLFYGTRRHGLFRSSDAGANWVKVTGFPIESTPNGNGIAFVAFETAGSVSGQPTPVLFAGLSRRADNFWVSRDGGRTWAVVPGGPVGLMPQRQARASDGTWYITFADGAGPHGDKRVQEGMGKGAVWSYKPATGQWRDITPAGWTTPFSGVDVDPHRPGRVMVSTINTYRQQPWGYGDRLFLSLDGGGSWTDLIGKRKIKMDDGGFPWIRGKAMHWVGGVTFDPHDSKRVFITSGNGIFRTDDVEAAEARWIFSVRGLEETVPMEAVSVPGGPLVSVILDYDGFVHQDVRVSPAGGAHAPHMGSCKTLAVASAQPRWMARAGGPLQISGDGGTTWKVCATLPFVKAAGGQLAWATDASSLLWTPGGSKISYRSGDYGASWEPIQGLEGATRLVADTVNPKRFYSYESKSGLLFGSLDGGKSFLRLGKTTPGGSSRLTAAPGHEGHLWIALGAGGLAFSADGGKSFERTPTLQSAKAVGLGKAAPGERYPTIYVWGGPSDGVVGVYRSTNRGRSWSRINDEAHEFGGLANGGFVVGDLNVFGRVYLSSAGRGILYGEPKATPRAAAR